MADLLAIVREAIADFAKESAQQDFQSFETEGGEPLAHDRIDTVIGHRTDNPPRGLEQHQFERSVMAH